MNRLCAFVRAGLRTRRLNRCLRLIAYASMLRGPRDDYVSRRFSDVLRSGKSNDVMKNFVKRVIARFRLCMLNTTSKKPSDSLCMTLNYR